MKQKGVYEAHEIGKEHGYLGQNKQHIDKGYMPSGGAGGEGGGSSYTLDENGGSIQRLKKFQEVPGRGNAQRPANNYGSSAPMLHNEAGVVPKGKNTKY